MTNAFKGEVAVTFEGKRRALVLDFNALADFEGETGKEALSWLEGLATNNPSAADMRAMIWAAMVQTDEAANIRDAGRLMSEHTDILMQLVQAASPEAAEVAEGNAQRPARRAKG